MTNIGRLIIVSTCACLFACGQLTWVNAAQLGDMPADKILFLGNSITYCPTPYSSTEWWGASASTRDNDYVHVLTQSIDNATGGSLVLEETPPDPERWYYGDPLPNYAGNIINIADIFERNYNTWDNARIQNQLDWNADIVVVQFGENLVAGSLDDLETALDTMLTGLKNISDPHIFITSNILNANPSVDALKQQLCADDPTRRVFVDVNSMRQNPANIGYAAHPNDAGMAVIADTIFNAMAPPPAPGDNMISNGGFDDDMSGWTIPVGSAGRLDGTEPNPSPDGPSAYVNLVTWIENKPTVPLVAGQPYEVSFLGRILGSAGTINDVDETLYAHVNSTANGVLVPFTAQLTDTWEEYSYQFIPSVDEVGGGYGVGFLNCAAQAGNPAYGEDETGWAQFGIDSVSLTAFRPGDANLDGKVDVSDLGILATHYGASSGAEWVDGDFSIDGAVNVSDLGILATNYGTGSATVATSEPTTLILLALGVLPLCCLRRRVFMNF